MPDCDNPSRAMLSKGMVHAKTASGGLLPRARMIPLTMAAILAVATAIECHAQARGIQSFLSWGFSLAYGCALWFWWALVVYVLWRSTNRWPSALRFSFRTLALHPVIAVGVVTLHLGLLQEV